MAAIDREPIEERAERVLAALPAYLWAENKPPIPIDDIADSYFGLHVCERSPQEMREAPGAPELGPGDTLSGLLLPSLGEIWVNADEAEKWPPRRRFTIAHEIGHHVMHRGQQPLFCRKKVVQEEEATPDDAPDIEEEASIFAASLLMPRELMKTYWERCGKRHDAMCKIFKASGAAMGKRLHTAL
ncbi:MAG: ImmA/IrrE family metallo-endopeptidase [Solirubrobacterales bacterium]